MLPLLTGIRILDLTTVVLGPYATQMLGDLGADVIKVEPLAGDVFRAARPGRSARMGAHYLNCNRNKRSLAIDLARPEGREVLHRLVPTVDVVVHNMRPKSAAKLGLGFAQLRALHSTLIYCYSSGFGQDGRLADEPAYDDTIQAVSGFAWLNAAEGAPRFLPTIVADKVAGLHLAVAVLAALASDKRGKEAICIEAPMFESMVSFLLVEQLAGRSFDPPLGRTGYHRLMSPHRKPYRTKDGFLAIIPHTGAHWQRFLDLIGRSDLAGDPRVTDSVQRSHHIDMLYALIEEAAPQRTTAEWLTELRARDIPCAEVNRTEDLLDHPHLADVGMFRHVAHPEEGPIVSVRSPFRAEGEAEDVLAPELGADTREVLGEAGFDAEAIEALLAAGVVAGD